jgi:peptide/nickel transport system permease protein
MTPQTEGKAAAQLQQGVRFNSAEPSRNPRKTASLQLWLGGALVGLIVVCAVFAPLLSPVEPDLLGSGRLSPPANTALFGTDTLGRDLFSRVLYGARSALYLSICATALSAIPGIFLGLAAGYHSGWFDSLLSRLMDAWLAFPGLLFAIVLVARLGPSLNTTVFALGLMGIPSFFRIVRSGVYSIKHTQYILSARAVGVRHTGILLRHVLPNLFSVLIVFTSMRLGTMILAGSGLSYIGLGTQPPAPDWGTMLASSRTLLDQAWWLTVFPGLAISASVLGFNLLGDGLRDLFASRSSVKSNGL